MPALSTRVQRVHGTEQSLADILRQAECDWDAVRDQGGSSLDIVKLLIGVVPDCDHILAIYPPAFRTYNRLVGSLLQLPELFLREDKEVRVTVGLAGYLSSKSAECTYCTSHWCSFAGRRGANEAALLGTLTEPHQAVRDVAQSMSTVPPTLDKGLKCRLAEQYNSEDRLLDAIVYAIGLAGFLNKFMDAMGIRLEQQSINDVAAVLDRAGWSPKPSVLAGMSPEQPTFQPLPQDSCSLYLKLLYYGPRVGFMEWRWTRDVPYGRDEVRAHVQAKTGCYFEVLDAVPSERARRNLASSLCDLLDDSQSFLGTPALWLVAVVFFTAMDNAVLLPAAKAAAKVKAPATWGGDWLKHVLAFSRPANADRQHLIATLSETAAVELSQTASLDIKTAKLAVLSRALAATPSINGPEQVDLAAEMQCEEVVELVAWMALLQSMHRLSLWYCLPQK